MRIALVIASLVLVGGTTVACGGSPEDADKGEFCDAYVEAFGSAEDFDEMKDKFGELEDVGTPEDMSDDAREGFEVMAGVVDDADDEEDLDKRGEDLDSDDEDKVEAFGEYAGKECADEIAETFRDGGDSEEPESGTGTETPEPSDMPSGMPSDMPSVDPSDYESLMSDYESYLSENPTP